MVVAVTVGVVGLLLRLKTYPSSESDDSSGRVAATVAGAGATGACFAGREVARPEGPLDLFLVLVDDGGG